MEHGEHDKAQKRSWSSTASGLSSRCPDTVLPLDPARSGWESEVDSARLSFTIIQFTAHVILISNTNSQQAHICKSYKSPVAMGERRSSRWGNTGSCNCGSAHRRLFCFVVYSTRRFVVCLSVCHFVHVFFSPFSIAITSLGEERANLSAFRTFVQFVLV